MDGFIPMSRNEAHLIIRADKRSALRPAVDEVFTILAKSGMTPREAEAVLIWAWEKVFVKGVLK